MKDCIIRIYRRGKNDPGTLVGAVEEIGVEGNKAFSNLDELWAILRSSKTEAAKGMRHNKHNGLNKPNKLDKLNKPLGHRKARGTLGGTLCKGEAVATHAKMANSAAGFNTLKAALSSIRKEEKLNESNDN